MAGGQWPHQRAAPLSAVSAAVHAHVWSAVSGNVPSETAAFSPISLFANGEQGAWYDPSDFASMFQGSVGTPPVTAVEQPVGLILDKRLGLSIVIYPPTDTFTFTPGGSTPPTTSSATTFLGVDCVSVTMPANAGGYGVCRAYGPGAVHTTTAGRYTTHTYQLALSRALTGGESIAVYSTGAEGFPPFVLTSSSPANIWITESVHMLATASGLIYPVVFAGSAIASTVTVYLRQYSATEIPGNHATQPTATARPVVSAPSYINYDGIDDLLVTTFPNLGSACTIARAVPTVGASILTGQTIGAGVRNDSTNHAGLVIIDRALTAGETTALTAYLDAKAGV